MHRSGFGTDRLNSERISTGPQELRAHLQAERPEFLAASVKPWSTRWVRSSSRSSVQASLIASMIARLKDAM